MKPLIKRDRTIIPALDCALERIELIAQATADAPGVGAFKIGSVPALHYGLRRVVGAIRERADRPVIYDHQKGATDIPDLGPKFMDVLKKAEVDAVILFPMSGPATLEAWAEAAKERELAVLVGGWMTHPKYLASQGGYIDDCAAVRIYELAADLGMTHFVVPGNNVDAIKQIRNTLVVKGVDPTLFAPGFVAQGGEITEAGKAAGSRWHAIVGRGIYGASDIKAAALELTGKL